MIEIRDGTTCKPVQVAVEILNPQPYAPIRTKLLHIIARLLRLNIACMLLIPPDSRATAVRFQGSWIEWPQGETYTSEHRSP